MGAYSRRKGRRGELQVKKALKDAGFEAFRSDQYRGGEVDGADLNFAACDRVFSVESKLGKNPSMYKAMKQCEEAAPGGTIPLAWVRRDRDEAYVVMRAGDLLDLLKGLGEKVVLGVEG